MIPVEVREIQYGTPLYDEAVDLRANVLRKPLGLGYTEEYLKSDADDIHIAAFADDKLVGCCILAKLDDKTFRLRQMTVAFEVQKGGVGAQMMVFSEKLALAKGATEMMLKSRESAIGFYQKCGYVTEGELFVEVTIPHIRMMKALR